MELYGKAAEERSLQQKSLLQKWVKHSVFRGSGNLDSRSVFVVMVLYELFFLLLEIIYEAK